MNKFDMYYSDKIINDIEEKISNFNWKNLPDFSNWDLGVNKEVLRDICNHWITNYSWKKEPLIQNFNSTIWRGAKIGIVGLNGSGKTTLLDLLLKKIEPISGSVTHGTKLEVAYFDQHRNQLDEKLTLAQNVHPAGEMVNVNGKPRHIISYLQDFLFTPHTSRSPITKLSGGERARLLLAKLFIQPANVLVLDEPTNDLDIETVELLEERLLEYSGTLLLVSHDRSFLENVVTSTIALEGNGQVKEYAGSCDEWLQRQEEKLTNLRPKDSRPDQSATLLNSTTSKKRSPTNKEREALKTLPVKIGYMEDEFAILSTRMASADYYQDSASDLTGDAQKLEILENEILLAYERLEALKSL